MLRTNKDKLVKLALKGELSHPDGAQTETRLGKFNVLPVTDAICYNVNIGDSVYGLWGDHIEPCASISNSDEKQLDALVRLSCIGNEALIMDGDAKGKKGFICGKHGGAWNIITYFDEEALEKLNYEEPILIKSFGQGLKLLDYPDIKVMNLDPNLLDRLPIEAVDGKIKVPVTAKIPGFLFGSGVGCGPAETGDVDFMTGDAAILKEYGLEDIKFGDFVMMMDLDHSYGTARMQGAVSIGLVIHGDSFIPGHGPGVTPILTCQKDLIEGILDPDANLSNYIENFKKKGDDK